MAMSLVDLVFHVYMTEGMIVNFMKLYLATINRDTMPCIRTHVLSGRELHRSAYEAMIPIYLRTVVLIHEGTPIFMYNQEEVIKKS